MSATVEIIETNVQIVENIADVTIIEAVTSVATLDVGVSGPQGPSGVVDVTAPITRTGTSSAAVIGINAGVPNGVATLDSSGLVPNSQLPPLAITDTFVVAAKADLTSLTAQVGDVGVVSSESKSYILKTLPASTLGNWQELLTPPNAVTSVDGQVGAVSLSSSYLSTSSTIPSSLLPVPVAAAWVSGTTYAVGDLVTYQTAYYERRAAGAGTTAPSSDTTNWAQRSGAGNLQGASSSTPTSLVAYNSTGGITAQGMAIGTPPATIPSTGLTVSNGSITVNGASVNVVSTGAPQGFVASGSAGYMTANAYISTPSLQATKGTTQSGVVTVYGLTSGSATITVPSVAGSPTLTLPTTSGTLALTSSIPSAATATPLAAGLAAVGTGTTYARADHVHPNVASDEYFYALQSNVTPANPATATAWSPFGLTNGVSLATGYVYDVDVSISFVSTETAVARFLQLSTTGAVVGSLLGSLIAIAGATTSSANPASVLAQSYWGYGSTFNNITNTITTAGTYYRTLYLRGTLHQNDTGAINFNPLLKFTAGAISAIAVSTGSYMRVRRIGTLPTAGAAFTNGAWS